jgi:hypothetical protein
MKIILLNAFLLLSSTSLCNNALFVFKSEKQNGENKATKFYNSMEISVNGIKLLQQDRVYKIRVNELQLDTIIIKGIYGSLVSDTILAKLNSGITYNITFNPCSNFQIIPSKVREGKKLVRVIATNRDENKFYLNSYNCFFDHNQLWNRDTTDYFYNIPSGMCPYAPTSFQMCSKDIEDINSMTDAKDCRGVMLYFSGNEMFTLYYDYKISKMTARFDGYYNEKLNIDIGEINRE